MKIKKILFILLSCVTMSFALNNVFLKNKKESNNTKKTSVKTSVFVKKLLKKTHLKKPIDIKNLKLKKTANYFKILNFCPDKNFFTNFVLDYNKNIFLEGAFKAYSKKNKSNNVNGNISIIDYPFKSYVNYSIFNTVKYGIFDNFTFLVLYQNKKNKKIGLKTINCIKISDQILKNFIKKFKNKIKNSKSFLQNKLNGKKRFSNEYLCKINVYKVLNPEKVLEQVKKKND